MRTWKLILIHFSLLACGCEPQPVNNYPSTSQQAGFAHLKGCGTQILSALRNYHSKHSEWPDSLDKLLAEQLIEDSALRYPSTYDLQDRRDLIKINQHVEWLYCPPSSLLHNEVVLIAPLPFTHSMGIQLESPHRIVVLLAEGSKIVKEEEASSLINNMMNRRNPTSSRQPTPHN
jgi:hypothetical protein